LDAGWVSELVWTQRLEEKSFVSAGDRTSFFQFVVRHYTDRHEILISHILILGILQSFQANAVFYVK
jgi:hypothetical protein